jgi:hypothetical protein
MLRTTSSLGLEDTWFAESSLSDCVNDALCNNTEGEYKVLVLGMMLGEGYIPTEEELISTIMQCDCQSV